MPTFVEQNTAHITFPNTLTLFMHFLIIGNTATIINTDFTNTNLHDFGQNDSGVKICSLRILNNLYWRYREMEGIFNAFTYNVIYTSHAVCQLCPLNHM